MTESTLPQRWRADLREAFRARDQTRAAVLRTLLAAVANAEAVDVADVAAGTTETARRVVDEDEVRAIVRAELASRSRAADLVAERNPEQAARLRAEAAIVAGYLG